MSMSKAKAETKPLPKRFYKDVAVGEVEGVLTILLDGRAVKTPARNTLSAPYENLAFAMAQEWADQDEVINPFIMPLTRLAHVAVDNMAQYRQAAALEIAKYASTDLLCYRAEDTVLAARQAKAWTPYLDWAASALDARFDITEGVVAIEQPHGSIEALRRHALALDNWRLTGLSSAVPILSSAILGFALLEAEGSGENLFEASRLDETYQSERWGEDSEAAQAAANKKRDLLAIERLFRLLDEAEG
ncbi:ATP12 family chaperone protein [Woodsholea maritima]|uniref:ATP12 family chaperone protein n=1 Tax=Woodsholea maritima TaxID=240237 RepID=UPI0003722CC6|nr:ATP12 family protein [Woodsholea maritima]